MKNTRNSRNSAWRSEISRQYAAERRLAAQQLNALVKRIEAGDIEDVCQLQPEEMVMLCTTSLSQLEQMSAETDWFRLCQDITGWCVQHYPCWKEEGDLYCSGVTINGHNYATDYSGVAGPYWRYENAGSYWG